MNDSATGLLGESQEEDRRHIADMVFAKMEVNNLPKLIFFVVVKGWVPWTERTIPLDAVLKASDEPIIFIED